MTSLLKLLEQSHLGMGGPHAAEDWEGVPGDGRVLHAASRAGGTSPPLARCATGVTGASAKGIVGAASGRIFSIARVVEKRLGVL